MCVCFSQKAYVRAIGLAKDPEQRREEELAEVAHQQADTKPDGSHPSLEDEARAHPTADVATESTSAPSSSSDGDALPPPEVTGDVNRLGEYGEKFHIHDKVYEPWAKKKRDPNWEQHSQPMTEVK
jgi:hypothetical protein